MTQPDVLTQLAANSPWAAMSGLLLWHLLKERTADRDERRQILSDVISALKSLSVAVENLAKEQRAQSIVLEKLGSAPQGVNH